MRKNPPASRISSTGSPERASSAKVSGKYRPTRSTLGSQSPTTSSGPHSPGGSAKRQTAASSQAGCHSSASSARLASNMLCIQLCHGSTNPRGKPAHTKSPRAGILP
jgi:hypothetical protein